MNRRTFTQAAAFASAYAAAGLPWAFAQAAAPDEGIDYRVLREAVPTSSQGKIEVLEFFWYACPHCYHLEPHLARWKPALGPDVAFKRIHVAFRGDTHQKIFYTLEALGRAEALTAKVFEEIHQRNNPLAGLPEVLDWAKRQGLDLQKFEAAWNSFGVQTQQKRANALVAGYRVEGVPTFGINGRYVTSPAMVGGSHTRALQIVDFLVAQERKTKR